MNEIDPFSLMATVFEHLREQENSLSNVMDELASLRDVLKETNPGFAHALESRLEYWKSRSAALRRDSNAIYDATIHLLRER